MAETNIKQGVLYQWMMPREVEPRPARLIDMLLAQLDIPQADIPRFLKPVLEDDPYFPQIAPAAEWLKGKKPGRVMINGDYDVDGCTSTTILAKTFATLGWDVHFFIPSRYWHSYGVNERVIEDTLSQSRFDLLVTADCGAASMDRLAKISEDHDLDVLVIDHHIRDGHAHSRIQEINPHLEESLDDGSYCTGVLACMLVTHLEKFHPELAKFRDEFKVLAGLAGIADVVSAKATGTRACMAHALAHADDPDRSNFGLAQLLKIQNVKSPLTTSDLGFRVIPLFNAAGRVMDLTALTSNDRELLLQEANLAMELFRTKDPDKVADLCKQLVAKNAQRQLQQKEIQTEVLMRRRNSREVVLECDEKWSIGAVGPAAGRIAEKLEVPCFLGGYNPILDVYSFSARSGGYCDIYQLLQTCAEGLPLHFGGHRAALGMRIEGKDIGIVDELRRRLTQAYESAAVSPRRITALLNPKSVSAATLQEQQALEPFGPDNPEPIYAVPNVSVTLSPTKQMGSATGTAAERPTSTKDAITGEIVFREEGKFKIVVFDAPKLIARNGEIGSLVGTLLKDTYKGKTTFSFKVEDIIPNRAPQPTPTEGISRT